MDWQRHRTIIMGLVALALICVTYWAVTTQTGDTPVAEGSEEAALPEVERGDITELEIHVPANEDEDLEAITVRLVKDGDDWRLADPDAPASTTAVGTALDKISTLEMVGRAATRSQHHERLEVDEAHGTRVIARNGSETMIDVWIGAYQAGNTMVRVEGQDEVLMVRGSIKFAFNKQIRDWRERAILQLTAGDVREIQFENENGSWTFVKSEDEWTEQLPEPAEGEEPPTGIENFDAGRVRTAVSSLARLRAADFFDGTPEEAGLDSGYATVRMVSGEGDEAQTAVLHIGGEAEEGQRYVRLAGGETIFIVSRFMADRLVPNVEGFQPSAEPETPPPPAGGMPAGMPGGGPGGGGGIPPELMQQIQRQLQQQGGGGHP